MLSTGTLPWRKVDESDKKQMHRDIRELKESTPREKLVAKTPLPETMLAMIRHLDDLEWNQRPDYGFLRSLWVDEIRRRGWIDASPPWQTGAVRSKKLHLHARGAPTES